MEDPDRLQFIDGDHTFGGVRRDFELFQSWLSDASLVALHDTLWENHKDNRWYREDMGVTALLEELRGEGFQLTTFPVFPGITLMHGTRRDTPLMKPCDAAASSS